MYRAIANSSHGPSSRRAIRVLEILIVLCVAPALAFGVWSVNSLPVA